MASSIQIRAMYPLVEPGSGQSPRAGREVPLPIQDAIPSESFEVERTSPMFADINMPYDFAIGDIVGSGSFTTVYELKDSQGNLIPDKVLKVFSYLPDGEQEPKIRAMQRFMLEGSIPLVGKDTLEGIQKVYDVIAVEVDYGGKTEFVPGLIVEAGQATISDYFNYNGLDIEAKTKFLARILPTLTEALDYLSAKKVEMADVKPNNIMLTGEAQSPRAFWCDLDSMFFSPTSTPKMYDFLARGSNSVFTTLKFGAPEVVENGELPIFYKSSQYSLALSLFYFLAPEDFKKNAKTNPNNMLKTNMPELNPGGSLMEVYKVLLIATSKNPSQRYSTNTEFASAFTAAVNNISAAQV